MAGAIWRVQEDNAGRWRDFPAGLKSQTEEAFQQWLAEGAPPGRGFTYVWANSSGTKFTEYAIAWPDVVEPDLVQREMLSCLQSNTVTGKSRVVQRIPIMQFSD